MLSDEAFDSCFNNIFPAEEEDNRKMFCPLCKHNVFRFEHELICSSLNGI